MRDRSWKIATANPLPLRRVILSYALHSISKGLDRIEQNRINQKRLKTACVLFVLNDVVDEVLVAKDST